MIWMKLLTWFVALFVADTQVGKIEFKVLLAG